MTSFPADTRLIYRAHLIELEGCWMEVRCPCGQTTIYAFKHLADRLGRDRRVGEIVSRVLCKACRARPATIHLNETPHRETGSGPQPCWSMQLFPPASI